jgi:hypothetical protein
MDRLRNFTKRNTSEFVTEQFRLLLEQISAFTPPKNLAQGRLRVAMDILKVMRPFDVDQVRDKRLKEIVQSGDKAAFIGYAKGVGKGDKWVPVDFDSALHKAARDRSGRVRRSGKNAKFVLGAKGESQLRKYIASEQTKVGIARNGWSPAIRAVGGKVPNWVSRHGPGFGAVIDQRNAENPALTAINRTPWAIRRDEGERIIREAMKSRTTRLESALRKQIELAAKQSGFAA